MIVALCVLVQFISLFFDDVTIYCFFKSFALFLAIHISRTWKSVFKDLTTISDKEYEQIVETQTLPERISLEEVLEAKKQYRFWELIAFIIVAGLIVHLIGLFK